MTAININDLTISSLLKTTANRITSKLLESTKNKEIHKTEKCNIIKKISELFKKFLLSKYDEKYHDMISRHWPTIFNQALSNAEISEQDLLVCHCARKVLEKLENVIAHIEIDGFYPFDDMELSSGSGTRAQNFLKFLFHPVAFDRRLLSFDNLKALFWRKDLYFMKEVREELKNTLENISSKFSTSFLSQLTKFPAFSLFKRKIFSDDFLVDTLVEQILNLYSYMEPVNGEILKIPQRINGHLKTGKYTVEKLMLVPKWLGGPIEAFALNPLQKGFPPILIFRGTPPNSTADGSFFASLTDYTPGFSVGESIYLLGKKQLHNWMFKTREKYSDQKVKVLGHSLGGSLTYYFAKEFPASTKVNAYDPAGLLPHRLSTDLKGRIFLHPNDIVSTLNYHPTSLEMFKVITDIGRNIYYAHMRPYGFEPTLFLRVNPTAENKRLARKVLLVFHTIYSIPFFIYKALYLLIMITVNKAIKSVNLNSIKKYKHKLIKS